MLPARSACHACPAILYPPPAYRPCFVIVAPELSQPNVHEGCSTDTTIERLYAVEGPRLLRYFRRRTGDSHSAPDLVQDAFARLAGTGRLADLVNPAGYLQRIARNLLIDRARGADASETFVPIEEWDAEIAPQQEDGILARDMLRAYEAAIADLPERTRTIFLLQRADDLTYRQISKRLGVTVWTVEYHMKRALGHLDQMLDDR